VTCEARGTHFEKLVPTSLDTLDIRRTIYGKGSNPCSGKTASRVAWTARSNHDPGS